ncbi:hypothetical protein DPMN_128835 [Dreissena polymorpha]|uniref:Uncharacterized protein n=1 Tax=Dreissena polymorpha TaxID=45954 RepID=A0A9D4K0I7_DREPO|nr:hypothetical protein DPMN_128835 [Dreissena polymorpha]
MYPTTTHIAVYPRARPLWLRARQRITHAVRVIGALAGSTNGMHYVLPHGQRMMVAQHMGLDAFCDC